MSGDLDWDAPFVPRSHSAVQQNGAFVDVQVRWSNAQVRSRALGGVMLTHAWMSHDSARKLAMQLAANLGVAAIPYRLLG